jgi:hypothetical protein
MIDVIIYRGRKEKTSSVKKVGAKTAGIPWT